MLPNGRLLVLAVLINFCTIVPVTYRTDIFNLPRHYVEQYMNETISERYHTDMSVGFLATLFGLMNSFTLIFEVPGSLATMYFLEKLGRKRTLMILQPILTIIALIIMNVGVFLGFVEALFVGRGILGFSGGLAMAGMAVYLIECTPPKFRGFIGSFQVIYFFAFVKLKMVKYRKIKHG